MTQKTFDYLNSDCPEILAKMMWYQHQQGREMDYSTGIDSREYGRGFSWNKTTEGVQFWSAIMNNKEVISNIPSFRIGDSIVLKCVDSGKKFIFIRWDLEHKAVWVMTESSWLLLNSRKPSVTNRQDIRKMPLQNIIWQV